MFQLIAARFAACAEGPGLTVMHYDGDYERIAEVTGQPVRWVVPRGSVDCRVAGGRCPQSTTVVVTVADSAGGCTSDWKTTQ